jgi:hypothetical protein
MTEQEEKILIEKVRKCEAEFKKLIPYAESTNLKLIQVKKEFDDYKRRTTNEIVELKKAINALRSYLRQNG